MSKPTYPSPQSLVAAKLCADIATARRILATVRGIRRDDASTMPPATAKWVGSCHNLPDIGEVRMEAFNELLGTHGVEAIFRANAGCTEDPLFTYCNVGDPYTATVIRHPGGRYRVGCWGDVIEALERRGVAVA